VEPSGANSAAWSFSEPVTLIGGNAPHLLLDSGAGLAAPLSAVQLDPQTIDCTYADGPGSDQPWEIATTPTEFTQSARITVPQDGTVI
jgi:hypothetical protein